MFTADIEGEQNNYIGGMRFTADIEGEQNN